MGWVSQWKRCFEKVSLSMNSATSNLSSSSFSELGVATLTGVGVSVDSSIGVGMVSTTTWNTRDTGGGVASSPGLDRALITGATVNDVRLAAIFGDVAMEEDFFGE